MWWIIYLLLALPPVKTPEFKEQVIDNNISIGYGMALGDVDGDKKPDIVLADKTQIVWYRNGDWKRFVIAENLTKYDNVCVAAKDVDGDGKVEIAVGAQWNPGETSNFEESGAVFYLQRPADPTQLWKPIKLQHEPTIHRMRWEQFSDGKYYLLVLPLHGVGNQGGNGAGVKLYAYPFPGNAATNWAQHLIDSSLHLTHNFDFGTAHKGKGIYIASKEGVKFASPRLNPSGKSPLQETGITRASGEIKIGYLANKKSFITTIEPMHGTEVVLYTDDGKIRVVLADDYKEGHALGVADFTGSGGQQVVAGWRNPNGDGKVGVKIFYPTDAAGKEWTWKWVDENGMACEDIQVLDMDGDGKPDIVASGRATKNLKIYWNQ